MRQHSATLVIGLATLLLGHRVAGQEIPCNSGPCMQPHRQGTHFVAELSGGGTFAGTPGLAVGGLLGVGGKPRGSPVRLYLVGELAYATSGQQGTLPGSQLAYREERDYRDLAMGVRIYLPVHGPLGLSCDLMGGASHVSALVQRNDVATVNASGWYGMGQIAPGLQVRIFRQVSVGLRAKVVLGSERLDELGDAVLLAGLARTSVAANLAWHF